MLGDLTLTFCEQSIDDATNSVEVWAFPDGTLNLVASRASGDEEHEESFPCLPEQLHQIVDGRPLRLQNEAALLVVERRGAAIEVRCSCGHVGWQQYIDLPTYTEGLSQNFAVCNLF